MSDLIGGFAALLISITLALYMLFYNPPAEPVRSGDCVKWREAKYRTFLGDSQECIEWKD